MHQDDVTTPDRHPRRTAAEEIHHRERGIVRRLVELMKHAKELGLNFTVLRALAEKKFAEQATPEKPEAVLRDMVNWADRKLNVGASEEWHQIIDRGKRCLDGLPPQLNLVDRGAQSHTVADGTQGMRRGE